LDPESSRRAGGGGGPAPAGAAPAGRSVAVLTLGCKINQYDANSMAEGLKASGHRVVARLADADVILVNTCTVTGRTDYKGRQLVRRAAQQNPGAVLMVVGCYAQVQPEVFAEIPGVDYVLGTVEKLHVAGWVAGCAKQPAPVVRTAMLAQETALDSGSLPAHSGTTRAFLKIQDGCDHACAYCIVPRARGRSRSLPAGRLLEKVSSLADAGFREVILCGIHLGRYGADLRPPVSLAGVLERLERDARVPRVRISSIEPNELTPELIDLFAGARHLCHHFHLPLQSGDARVLRAMNRPYGPADFAGTVERIHRRMPDAAIGVDVIAGFPGEDAAAFDNTLGLLRALPVSYFHVFPYSSRPGTPACGFPDRVPPEAIRERAEILRMMGRRKRLRFHEGFVGRRLEVLVETRRDASTGMLKGVSRNYLTVLCPGSDAVQGRLVEVRVRSADERRAAGEMEPGEDEAGMARGGMCGPGC